MFDELLKKYNVTRESLTDEERSTLESWSKRMSIERVGIPEVQKYLDQMITSMERELTGHDVPVSFTAWLFRGKRLRHLNARLYNYIMLRDFISAPDKARAFVEKHITNIKPS